MKILVVLLPMLFLSCSTKESPKIQRNGSLFYSSTNELLRYDFGSKQLHKIYDLEYDYAFSPDASEFLSYDVDEFKGETAIRIHPVNNPATYQQLRIPYKLTATPKFIPNSDFIAVLAPSVDEPILRDQLILFDRKGVESGRIPHIKDFGVTSNGKDVIVSAESLDQNGAPNGYAVALVKNFMEPDNNATIVLHTFQDYQQLPVDLVVSPDNQYVAFSYLDHIYTLALTKDSDLRQITDSRFLEADPGWSPNGQQIVFGFQASDHLTDCGEIRVVSAAPAQPAFQMPGNGDNAPVNDLQPVKMDGKVLGSCNSHGILWKE